jgi:hypothetical protein
MHQVAEIGASGTAEGEEAWRLAEEVGGGWPRPASRLSAAAVEE